MLTRGWGRGEGAGGGLGVTATGVTAVGLAWAVLGAADTGCDAAAGPGAASCHGADRGRP